MNDGIAVHAQPKIGRRFAVFNHQAGGRCQMMVNRPQQIAGGHRFMAPLGAQVVGKFTHNLFQLAAETRRFGVNHLLQAGGMGSRHGWKLFERFNGHANIGEAPPEAFCQLLQEQITPAAGGNPLGHVLKGQDEAGELPTLRGQRGHPNTQEGAVSRGRDKARTLDLISRGRCRLDQAALEVAETIGDCIAVD